ncbi:MAG: histidinol dehydrogenase [Candidatus Neomarinimicrobiota bacterium]
MKYYKYPNQELWNEISQRPQMDAKELMNSVEKIMKDVRDKGDKALKAYTKKFDKVEVNEILCSEEELENAENEISDTLKNDIRLAISNIRKFHGSQMPVAEIVTTMPGVYCWREARAIEKVGLYVPGGTAPLFSSVLMLAIPAQIAGCKEIVLCSPPQKDGKLHPAILWAAKETGVTHICKVGGAQAIAAMTYGTESVPAVYKILGPGNQYVTAAKMQATLENTAIDMPAGPSEVLIIADSSADIEFLAADLLSQAEHGIDSQAVLVTDDKNLAEKISEEVEKQLKVLSRADIAKESLKNSKIVLMKDLNTCVKFSNDYAPEHLIINTRNSEEIIPFVVNAGSVFVGPFTPESAGDYASGTNHTLPTAAFAKNYSGVSLDSYLKMITFQSISEKGLDNIGPAVENMAEAEGLDAHKMAVTRRLNKIKKN